MTRHRHDTTVPAPASGAAAPSDWLLLPGFLALFALAAALRWPWLAGDLNTLVRDVVPDDAFYYFEVCVRLWRGEGVTFDGVEPATGFHLLWLCVILPFFRNAAAGDPAPVRAALWLATFLHVAAALCLYRINLRALGRRAPAALLCLAFTLNLFVLRESLNGLETALSVFLLCLFLNVMAWYWEAPGARRAAWLAAVVAGCILARTDNAVVLLPPCLLLLRPDTRALRDAALVAGAAFGALAVILCFTWLSTGGLLQSSAAAVPWVVRDRWLAAHPDASAFDLFLMGLRHIPGGLIKVARASGAAASVAGFGSVLAAAVLLCARRPAVSPALRRALWLVVLFAAGLAALHAAHGVFRWMNRAYYFAAWPLLFFTAPAIIWAALAGPHRNRALSAALTVWLAVGAVTLAAGYHGVLAGQYPWQEETVGAAALLDRLLPPDEPVGAFNAGILGYCSARPVVNLDGVVNETAARQIRQRRLADYLHGRGLRYLLDSPAMWGETWYFAGLDRHFHPDGAPLRHSVVAEFDLEGVGWPDAGHGMQLIGVGDNP
ncbi:MAG: hypothetical protein GX580_02460 [Candidatus Hydrogenedens sp.]|nr:hypothetical protein [Candidatus Hydrogenedentota bacterium]NLF56480.1 hypothetical protein [Candidatus Hydrogenedens sp.]